MKADPSEEESAEVDRPQEQDQQDRQKQRSLNQSLARRAVMPRAQGNVARIGIRQL
jgi:hypothetical protein